MQYDEFIKLTEKQKLSAKLYDIYLAIWYILKDNHEIAHKIVQKLNTEEACWLHAYLHRAEGDLENANYWYSRVNKDPKTTSLATELNDIITSVFNNN